MIRMKLIFVSGGVISGLGKGITASSIGRLLESRGIRVSAIKVDPYLNVDAGTMNPYEHGEVYVLDDGGEVDLDLGNYERFMDLHLTRDHNITTGKVYRTVIENERRGEYLGKTVQIIPHVTDEIKRRITSVARDSGADVVIVELGGTVGDMESQPFVEAVRQLQWELPEEDCVTIHLTLVPYLSAAKELKTKPTQHSVQMLQQNGVQPDIIVCRTEHKLTPELRKKVALFCNVRPGHVIESMDAPSIYMVPLNMKAEKLDQLVLDHFRMTGLPEPDLDKWNRFLEKLTHPKSSVDVALVGKYVELQDAYKSILESFVHAGAANECKVNVHSIHSEFLNQDNVDEKLGAMDGILVAPGFGERGLEGKIAAVKYAREHNVPFFGICLGMQMCVVEFARDVLGLKDAVSTEVNPATPVPIIDLMEDQKSTTIKGGTMRLGAYDCQLEKGSLAYRIYGKEIISERHRHRYEFNNDYLPMVESAGMKATGKNPDTGLVEIVEIPTHPFFIGVQFHPELKSTPEHPQPIFVAFVKAAMDYRRAHRKELESLKPESEK